MVQYEHLSGKLAGSPVLSHEPENALQAELAAMRDIALVLAELDEVTRARVINWAAERFDSASPQARPQPPARRTAAGETAKETGEIDAEDALSVSRLDEFFDLCDAKEPCEGPAMKPEPAVAEPRLSLVTKGTPGQRASKAV